MTGREQLDELIAELLVERYGPLPTRPPPRRPPPRPDPPADDPHQQSARRRDLLDAITPEPGDED